MLRVPRRAGVAARGDGHARRVRTDARERDPAAGRRHRARPAVARRVLRAVLPGPSDGRLARRAPRASPVMASTTWHGAEGRSRADRAARHPAVRTSARIGLVARGVLYVLVGVLALRLAFG